MNRRQILQIGGGVAVLGAVGAGAWWLTRPAPQQTARTGDDSRSQAGTSGDRAGESASRGAVLEVGADERILGDADAPVTLIDYSSLTCPHCARFHTEVLPRIKSDWVDSGRARVVYRHFPLDRLALAAALSAECIEQDKAYFAYLDVLFEDQQAWSRAEDPLAELQKRARLAGLSPERFDACVRDQAMADRILERVAAARDTLEVSSTPTFFVDGEKIAGAQDYETFDQALRAAAGEA
jgi:protein-disulfide isomerase